MESMNNTGKKSRPTNLASVLLWEAFVNATGKSDLTARRTEIMRLCEIRERQGMIPAPKLSCMRDVMVMMAPYFEHMKLSEIEDHALYGKPFSPPRGQGHGVGYTHLDARHIRRTEAILGRFVNVNDGGN